MLGCLCPIGVRFSNNSKLHFSARWQEGIFASLINITCAYLSLKIKLYKVLIFILLSMIIIRGLNL
jgi:hypothetical protein